MQKRVLAGAAMSALLTGCAFSQMDAAQQAVAAKPLTCTVGPECDAMWGRVAPALRHYTPHGIRDETAEKVNNYLPRSSSTAPWFRVRKIDRSNGTAEIRIDAGCMNVFGCSPDVSAVAAKVSSYVRTGTH
jgi:hypothetical protein